MRALLFAPALLAGLLSLTGCEIDDFGSFGRYSKDFHESHALKAGGRLSIETFNGSVELSGWDQEMVDISGTKVGPSPQAADDLKIQTDSSPDSLSIRAVRPSERRGNWGVRFVVKMPRRAVLDLIKTSNGQIHIMDGTGPGRFRSSNGAIRIEGFEGSVDAQTSNGPVELADVKGEVVARTSNGRIHADNLSGALQANTSNGGITANLAASVATDRPLHLETSNSGVDITLPAKFNNDVRISTSNGPITLHIPSELNARVQARTNNASINSDFEVRMQGEFNKNHMDGMIGTGGPLFDLSTSNGGIRLLKM
ncbi:MAG: DUF4097 family beta strand repeat-containing protein [Acidobacteriia bacterium]|nr:DUF4097 family beta strand repeat-containing protein [Terriglobia bacterium]